MQPMPSICDRYDQQAYQASPNRARGSSSCMTKQSGASGVTKITGVPGHVRRFQTTAHRTVTVQTWGLQSPARYVQANQRGAHSKEQQRPRTSWLGCAPCLFESPSSQLDVGARQGGHRFRLCAPEGCKPVKVPSFKRSKALQAAILETFPLDARGPEGGRGRSQQPSGSTLG